MTMDHHLIVSGVHVPVEADVVHHLMPRPPSYYRIVPRKAPPDLGVIHYTGAENPASTVMSTLRARRLSIHYIIDREGVIHQCVDPGVWSCAHAGARANRRSIGVEVVCYGWCDPGRRCPDPERPTYETTIHGWHTTLADFYPAQYDALEALIGALPLPARVPEVLDRRLTDVELEDFAAEGGWVGHYHVVDLGQAHPKVDPGPGVMERLG